VVAVSAWTVGASAAIDPFYLDLYKRGITHFDAGDHVAAARELRLAAFGSLESLELFETAHIYAAIASANAKEEPESRRSAQRVVAAERVARTYAKLAIPSHIRTQFETIAKRSLTDQEWAFLMSQGPPPPPAAPPVIRSTPAPVPVPAPAPARPPAPAPASVTPAPAPAPQPVVRTPAPQPPPQPPPQPVPSTTTTAGETPAGQPAGGRRSEVPPAPAAPAAAAPPAAPPAATGTLAEADRALAAGDLTIARRIYSARLDAAQVPHVELIKIGEGLYRSRDFRGAARAFGRAGAFAKGEEPYHYYYAVALYETGQYGPAKRELAAALPFIEMGPDVVRYRAKIEGALE
jgi:hypothetical protein